MISLEILQKHYKNTFGQDVDLGAFQLGKPPKPDMGDFALACFPFARDLKIAPPQIAQQLSDSLVAEDVFSDVQAMGGFVNITLSDSAYIHFADSYTIPTHESNDQTVLVDYNQPNIGKPLHIAHLCTPTFGQATINLLRYKGYIVYGDMHQGDWGGIFGKLITGWRYFGSEEEFEKDSVQHLFQLYVQITAKAEEDPQVDQECRDAFRKLSDGNKEYVELWKRFTRESLERVQMFMDQFGVYPDFKIGESFYEGLDLPKLGDWPDLDLDTEKMSTIVEELIEMGIAERNEDGSAGVIFPKEEKLPSCILQKRDGTHGYLASDLASIKYRIRNWSPSKILYFVDNRQALHFRQLFSVARRVWNLDIDILSHEANGFVSLKDGAMSTRKGRIIPLWDVMIEGEKRVQSVLESKNRELSPEDISAISIGAIKYSFLMQDRERDWVFDWDKVLSFEGNSGPYIQYALVRARKMLAEFGTGKKVNQKDLQFSLSSYDKNLLRDIADFQSICDQALGSFKFHSMANWCYELANHLNSWYTNVEYISTDDNVVRREFRLHMLSHVVQTLEKAFEILALPSPSKM